MSGETFILTSNQNNMNSEASRLETFDNWPSAAAVSPERIARAGFFYTKHNLTVECFSCHVQITEWNYGDQVMAKHKLLSPGCLFVENPLASGNIPKLTGSSATPTEAVRPQSEDYKDEAVRLSTFTCWPKTDIITPEALAKAGFFSLKYKDFTKCAFCDVVLISWESGDDPDKEHKRCAPQCMFVQTVINQRLGQDNKLAQLSNLRLVCSDNFQDLGVQEHRAPKNLKYVTVESRLQTFTNWPSNVTQKPEDMANAGFYYEGILDRVRCFHCDGGLNRWDPQDEPLSQHALWFPTCAFVQILKGTGVVEMNNSLHEPPKEEQGTAASPSISLKRRVTDREVEEFLSTEPALVALNIGLQVGRIKQAIKNRLEETGAPFISSDALIEATLNIQMDEDGEDEAMHVDDSSLSEGVSRVLTKALQNVLRDQKGSDNSEKLPEESPKSSNEQEEAKTAENAASVSLEEENRMLKEARMCKICMDAEVGIVFLPCGHLTTCITCATNIQYCPLCRSTIKATVRTFLS